MFKIRNTQLQAFEAASLSDFEERTLEELRGKLSEQISEWSDEDLVDYVRQALGRAKTYGLETEFEVICFAQAMILLGQDFDTDPKRLPAQIILGSPNLSSEDKGEFLVVMAQALVASQV